MRTLITLFLFVSICPIYAQWNQQEQLGAKIIEVIEDSKMIKEMILNKKTILQQLKDVDHWANLNKISKETYVDIKTGYTDFALQMNSIYLDLFEELREIERTRDFRAKRFEKILRHFNNSKFKELLEAKKNYEENYVPAFKLAISETESKSIVPILAFILEFGETLFTSIKELIETGSISKENEKLLLAAGLEIAIDKLENKLLYPSWDTLMFSVNEMTLNSRSNDVTTTRSTLGTKTSSAQVQLIDFYTKEPIKLVANTKQIIVGEHPNASANYFETNKVLKPGDKFQVILQNASHVSFFYFDYQTNSWVNPMGKSIVVGEASNHVPSQRTLPTNSQFFEITGSNPYEEFLILLSDTPLNSKIEQVILSTKKTEIACLDLIEKKLIDSTEFSAIITNLNTTMETIALSKQGSAIGITPLYIKINKASY